MGYEFYSQIRKYWKGEIDEYTLAENLTSTLVSTGASFAGAAGAVAICAGAGPWGLGFAAIAGGVIAAGLSDTVVRGVFQCMFGSSRGRALEKAFQTLELKEGASDQDVRSAYLNLAKRTHPDKGGDQKKFVEVNSAYELIRASRLAV